MKIRIFVTYRIKDILSFIKVKSIVSHEVTVLLVVDFIYGTVLTQSEMFKNFGRAVSLYPIINL